MRARDVVRGGLATALGAWFTGSVLAQHPFRKDNWIRQIDPWGLLIPDWRFFAPNPGIHDYHLLYRNRLASGEQLPFHEVGYLEERSLRHIFWHPHRRLEKVLFDVTAEILRYIGEKELGSGLTVSVPYLTLLTYIDRHCDHHPDAVAAQFLIAASGGYDDEEPTMLFLSHFHPLASRPAEDRADPPDRADRIPAEALR